MLFMQSLNAGCSSRRGLNIIDAEVDAAPPMPCGNSDWTEPGSPWPVYMGCPERRSRSAAVGPATPENIRYVGEISNSPETEEWRLEAMSHGGPVIASDGTLYIGSSRFYHDDGIPPGLWSQQILAIDPDGSERLIYETELIALPMDAGSLQPPNGFAISIDGHIYFGVINSETRTNHNENEIILAFDKNGAEVYQSRPYHSWHKALGPDGVFYANEHVDESNKYLVALAHDGTELWRYKTKNHFASSLALDPQGRIYFFLQEFDYAAGWVGLLALQPDGTLLWEKRISDFKGSQLSIGDNGSLYFFAGERNKDHSFDYSLYAYSSDGEFLWSHPVDGVPGQSLAIGPGSMVVGAAEDIVYAFSPDGEILWTYEDRKQWSAPGGRPAIDGEGTTYIVMQDGLRAIRRDGTLKWKAQIGTPWQGVVIGADGTLYFSCGKKGLCVIEH